ncbi:AbrB/MazE/SpoVT family DNA-binding domain-containing protein [Candidatus Woesearchaeota archaeon]|nr:AbrB/MazE/SpoVT family DNA-binding domain-containing protein [Candidatus Woesearchaeota archaeon]
MIVKISKGQQITIPSEFRKDLKLKAGSKVDIIKKQNKIIIQPIEEDLDRLFDNARKILPKHKLTAKQMDELAEHEILG